MNEIIKGMANASEAIQENFEEIDEHLAESASKHIHSSGSNDDGYWVRFDDGTQICWGNIRLPYATAIMCRATVSYPKAFSNAPSISANLINYSGTPTYRDMTSINFSNILSTSVKFAVWTQRSATATWESGDHVDCTFIAIGRWK